MEKIDKEPGVMTSQTTSRAISDLRTSLKLPGRHIDYFTKEYNSLPVFI